MRKVINTIIDLSTAFVERIKINHLICAVIITIIVAMIATYQTRDRSYNDYPIDAVIDRPACLEIIYDGNKKKDTFKAKVEIDEKSYVRVYNNHWDEPEVYMTLDMYSNLFVE